MELVTLANATLHRIGSATSRAVVRHSDLTKIREVPDASPETLRELVLLIAEENGEARESLKRMEQEPAFRHGLPKGHSIFNIQGHNVSYSFPYATCYAYSALKIGQRYFKLDEVEARDQPT